VSELELAKDGAHSPATRPADFQVSPETLDMIARSDAENTRTAYQQDWDRFERWCESEGRTPLPATPQTFADYVQHLASTPTERGTLPRPATIDRAMGTIGRRHNDAGMKLDRRAAARVFKTYRKEWAHAGNRKTQAKPAVVDAIRAMVSACDLATLTGIRDRAIILLGFAIMGRRSEVTSLNVSDITNHENGMIVLIRMSKTDQDAKGAKVPIRYADDPTLCPVVAVQAWLAAMERRGVKDGPLFRRIDRNGRLGGTPGAAGRGGARLSPQSVHNVVQRLAQAAGLENAEEYKGHSLRAGGATAAAAGGATVSAIADIGRWSKKSTTVHEYVRAVDMWEDHPMKGVL
jgi:site-specific recombinase XerD